MFKHFEKQMLVAAIVSLIVSAAITQGILTNAQEPAPGGGGSPSQGTMGSPPGSQPGMMPGQAGPMGGTYTPQFGPPPGQQGRQGGMDFMHGAPGMMGGGGMGGMMGGGGFPGGMGGMMGGQRGGFPMMGPGGMGGSDHGGMGGMMGGQGGGFPGMGGSDQGGMRGMTQGGMMGGQGGSNGFGAGQGTGLDRNQLQQIESTLSSEGNDCPSPAEIQKIAHMLEVAEKKLAQAEKTDEKLRARLETATTDRKRASIQRQIDNNQKKTEALQNVIDKIEEAQSTFDTCDDGGSTDGQ